MIERYVVPFRASGDKQLVVRAGDVAKEMWVEGRLPNGRVPNVCNVLSGPKFLVPAGLRLVWSGSAPSGESTTMRYRYELDKGV